MKLNTEARKRVATYTEFFKSNGYDEGEARALATAYYKVLADRFLRIKAAKQLDSNGEEIDVGIPCGDSETGEDGETP
jgi:hypothetical protein